MRTKTTKKNLSSFCLIYFVSKSDKDYRKTKFVYILRCGRSPSKIVSNFITKQ